MKRSTPSTIAALSACAVLAGCSSAPVDGAPVVHIAEVAKPSPSRALDQVLPTVNELATILGSAGFMGQLVKGGPEMLLQGVRESEATPIDCVSAGYRLQKIVYQASPVRSVASQPWVGGDQNGMVVDDYLAQKGAQVTVAEPGRHFGHKLAAHDRWYLLNRQNDKHVKRIKNVHDMNFTADGGVQLDTGDGPVTLPVVDSIVFAGERKSDRSLVEVAERLGARVIVVGDAHDVSSENAGTIFANIANAYDNARQL